MIKMTPAEQDCEDLITAIRKTMTLSVYDEKIVRKAFILGYDRGCRREADFVGALNRARLIFRDTFRTDGDA